MHHLGILWALLIALTPLTVQAQGKVAKADAVWAAGVGGGNLISGFSIKKVLSKNTAVQGVLGSAVYGMFGAAGGADYMVSQPELWRGDGARLRWGVGAGAAVVMHSGGSWVDASAVIELVLRFDEIPLELVSDYRPGYILWLGSSGAFGGLHLGTGGGAVRWYF